MTREHARGDEDRGIGTASAMADSPSPSWASARRRSAISTAPFRDDDAHAILEAAWETGRRYFDTAPLYGLGLSETRLNRFLRGKKRDDYVLSTKVGRLLAGLRRRNSAPASASSSTRRRAARSTTTAMTASCARSSSRWSGSASTASTSSTRTTSTSSRTARRRRCRPGSRSSWRPAITRCCRCATRA